MKLLLVFFIALQLACVPGWSSISESEKKQYVDDGRIYGHEEMVDKKRISIEGTATENGFSPMSSVSKANQVELNPLRALFNENLLNLERASITVDWNLFNENLQISYTSSLRRCYVQKLVLSFFATIVERVEVRKEELNVENVLKSFQSINTDLSASFKSSLPSLNFSNLIMPVNETLRFVQSIENKNGKTIKSWWEENHQSIRQELNKRHLYQDKNTWACDTSEETGQYFKLDENGHFSFRNFFQYYLFEGMNLNVWKETYLKKLTSNCVERIEKNKEALLDHLKCVAKNIAEKPFAFTDALQLQSIDQENLVEGGIPRSTFPSLWMQLIFNVVFIVSILLI
ncbi:hypothetical protein HMI54_014837 [Coelomomyces lativittatus]|nr:hypothetical protein HMI56_001896 [Coelomomyces lativittatus]KAJ1507948.1 hypothetical protein HMI55_000577 [Coelomomyces lativittatus]KAJ1513623.1 hypothetical protein HMI54_014837 [Coelomomyces lativittatus]